MRTRMYGGVRDQGLAAPIYSIRRLCYNNSYMCEGQERGELS